MFNGLVCGGQAAHLLWDPKLDPQAGRSSRARPIEPIHIGVALLTRFGVRNEHVVVVVDEPATYPTLPVRVSIERDGIAAAISSRSTRAEAHPLRVRVLITGSPDGRHCDVARTALRRT